MEAAFPTPPFGRFADGTNPNGDVFQRAAAERQAKEDANRAEAAARAAARTAALAASPRPVGPTPGFDTDGNPTPNQPRPVDPPRPSTPIIPGPTRPTTPPVAVIPPTTPLGPQVIQYGTDTWKNDPTIAFLNGKMGYDQANTLSNRSSYDPATGVELQSPRSMNANTLMQIQNDPMRLAHIRSVYLRANRNWDKEVADAMAAGPRGNASAYTRTG